MFVVRRSHHNPILIPDRNHYWESFATFNLCPIVVGKKTYGFYRAISASDSLRTPKQISTVGMGISTDGKNFEERVPFITPEAEWDKFGCEDPRVTHFEGKYYIFYTGLSAYPPGAESIKVAVGVSKDLKKLDERHLVTPFNAKAMTLFPERIGGKAAVIFSAHTDSPPAKMCIALADNVEDFYDKNYWEKWHKEIDAHAIDPRRSDHDHVEVGAPPIKTKYGWLLIYSHIQNYFSGGTRIFGIEALLLDLKDPSKIIGRTRGPLLTPEEPYELSGFVPNVVFPSGATLEKDLLSIFYGAADTTTCCARVSLNDLLSSMRHEVDEHYFFKRFKGNPILLPDASHPWESKAVFNPASILLGGKTHIIYRALSEDNTSTFGYAGSKDGYNITERDPDPIYVPREDFEQKKIGNANSGCEDPRLTRIGNNIYMCYTAFDGIGPPRVAITSITLKDFLNKNWNWTKPSIITPTELDDKDTCLFDDKFPLGYFILHRVDNIICGDYLASLDFKLESVKKCVRVIGPRVHGWDSAKVGIAAPPIKTKHGWLLLYHGVSKSHGTYRVGAVLLDLHDPAIVLARTTDPIFEPEMEYEKVGIVNNVVFPCGLTVKDGLMYIYYGGGDKVVGVATIELDVLLGALVRGMRPK
jgi:predicted GH43/DUF377 family glycosyl hydrolase